MASRPPRGNTMKVFATVSNNGDVRLCEWTSKKAFEVNQSWIDPKFINVATTEDLNDYNFPYEKGAIIYSDEQIASQNLLHKKYMELTA
tara:strand:- start:1057 stop:1323 length:267 start_codon:yes stop_codon:yes gene_type:complete